VSDPEDGTGAEDTESSDQENVEDPSDGADRGAAPAANAVAVLEYLVKQVVGDPEAVSVSTSEGRRGGLQLDVRVGDGDMGRVIGKRGRIAQSIRTVVRAAAVKDDTSVDIEFVD
jgi:predicted RNA-binding protein YlqC (UPF0109 family)